MSRPLFQSAKAALFAALVAFALASPAARASELDLDPVRVDFWASGPTLYHGLGAPAGAINVSMLEENYSTNPNIDDVWRIASATAPEMVYTPVATIRMIPGKSYPVYVALYNMSNVTFFNAHAQGGYRLIFDGQPVTNGSPTLVDGGIYQMRVIPAAKPETRRAGTSSPLSNGKLHWELFLGQRFDGQSAGSLAIFGGHALQDWSHAYTPTLLNNTLEHEGGAVYRSAASAAAPEVPHALRQVKGYAVFADIVTISATKYEIRLYQPTQATGSAFPYTFSGSPHTVYVVSKGAIATSLEIAKRTYGAGSAYPASPTQELVASVKREGSWPDYVWTAEDWHAAGQPAQTQDVRTFSQEAFVSDEDYELREAYKIQKPDGAGAVVALEGHRVHKKFSWGESVIEEHRGPAASKLTTDNEYYEAAGPDQGKLQSVVRPGDGWIYYAYGSPITGAAPDGTVMPNGGYITYEPHLDLPAAPAADPSGKVTRVWYSSKMSHGKRDIAKIEVRIAGQLVQRTEYVDDPNVGSGNYGNYTGYQVDRETKKESFGEGATDVLPTITRYFPYVATEDMPLSRELPDGSKTVYAYHIGSYNPATKAFAPGVGSLYRRVTQITGTAHAVPGGAPLASYEGATLVVAGDSADAFHITTNRSAMSVTITSPSGQLLRAETRIWSGSAWELVTWEDSEYDVFGHLVRSEKSNGDLYEATYAGDLKTSETDADGIIRSFEYDFANRLAKTTRSASILAVDPTPAVSVLYSYDAAGRTTSTTVSSAAPSEQLASSTTYDTAGRVVSEKGPNAPATTYAYDVDNRTVTATYPHGATRIEERHLDGRLKSVTGTGAVHEFHAYAVETLDLRPVLYSRVNYGSVSSPRLSETWTDMLGRTVKTSTPGFAGTVPADPASISRSYFDAMGRLVRSTTTGYADTLYEYDAFGQLSRSGLDVNADGDLDLASTERVTDTESVFEKIGSDWWATTTTRGYLVDGASTSNLLSITRQRLSGHPANQRAETQTTDADGAVTTVTTTVTRAFAHVSYATERPGHTMPAVHALVNGLTVAERGHDGATFNHLYDSLGRLVVIKDPRIGETVTAYKPGTTLPSSVTQPNGDQTQTLYDAFGRVSETKDPLLKSTYYGYDAFGRQDRQWGPGSNPSKRVYDATYGDLHQIVTWRGTDPVWNATTWPTAAPTDYQQITTFQTDVASGLLRSKAYSGGDSVVYGYDVRRQVDYRSRVVESATTASTVTYSYDPSTGALASQTYVQRAEDEPTTNLVYGYDRAGRVTSIADAAGTRTYAYDTLKPWRLASETLGAALGSRRLTYQYQTATDANGLVGRAAGYRLGIAANTDADARAAWAYDDKGRLLTVNAYGKGGAGLNAYTYAYLANTRFVESVTSSSHSIAWARETDTHRLLSVDTKWGEASLARYDYAYTPRGQRDWGKASGSSLALDGGLVTHDYHYDDRGQLDEAFAYSGDETAIGTAALKMPHLQFEYSYDHAGNLLSANRSGSPALAEASDYGDADRIESRQTKAAYLSGSAPADAPVAAYSGFAAVLAARQASYWSAALAPDNASGPDVLPVDVYARQGSSVSKKSATLHVGAASQTLAHDPDGNLLSDGVWELKYDAEHRLTKAATTAAARAAGVPAWEVRHRYDHQGRRFERQQRLDGEVVETRRYVHQGWNIVAEYTVSASALTLDRTYTWGLDLAGSGGATGGVGALLQIQDHHNGPEPAGQASYDERGVYRPAWDGIGNLVALYKDGAEAAVYEYSPYGELLRSRGPYADHNPLRYGSKLADPLTGLIDFGKRHYSPALARFVTRDPLQEGGGLNLYRYAGNDPINAIDVLGLALVDQPASNPFLTTGGLSGNLSNGTSNSAGEGGLDTFELAPFTVHGANNINLDTHWTNIRTNYNPFMTSDARGMPVYDYKYTWHGAAMAEIASMYEARQEAILRRAEMTFNAKAHEESKKKAERERGTRLEDGMPGDFWGAEIDQGLSGRRGETETITLSFREVRLPGGRLADMMLGKRHVSVKTSEGETGQGKVGADVPGQGSDGFAPTLKSEMIDHTGESTQPGVINIQVTVNRDIFLDQVRLGQPMGYWFPLINDCNVTMENAVRKAGGDWDGAYQQYLDQNSSFNIFWEVFQQAQSRRMN